MHKTNKKTFAIFVGGETGGPVVPLLAVAKLWHEQDPTLEPVFVDIKKSVSSRIVPQNNFMLKTIRAGKMRRYFTIKNFFSPLLVLIGFIQSVFLLFKLKPKVVVGAGGYVQIPVMYAAWVLRIPRIIHQQDVVPTLANKICAPIANKITTTFEKSVKDFPQGLGFSKNYGKFNKVFWTGNPCNIQNLTSENDKAEARKLFKITSEFPTVLVSGGGSGAKGLNQALVHNLPDLLKVAQVIHSTGVGKKVQPPTDLPLVHDRYRQYEYIKNMDKAYAIADIVIARAGVGTITELSATEKISIIIPMPNSHQEVNAQYLYNHDAAIVIDQLDITPDLFAKVVRKILFDLESQKEIKKNIRAIMPQNADKNMLNIILDTINA